MSQVPFDGPPKTEFGGLILQRVPRLAWQIPRPFMAPVWSDPVTGEIYGETVLMCRLPWPRFRCFTYGKQVVLPLRSAEALKWCETEVGIRPDCRCSIDEYSERRVTTWIEVSNGKVYPLYFCNVHYHVPLYPRKKPPRRSYP